LNIPSAAVTTDTAATAPHISPASRTEINFNSLFVFRTAPWRAPFYINMSSIEEQGARMNDKFHELFTKMSVNSRSFADFLFFVSPHVICANGVGPDLRFEQ
jgi:hypothetical protein